MTQPEIAEKIQKALEFPEIIVNFSNFITYYSDGTYSCCILGLLTCAIFGSADAANKAWQNTETQYKFFVMTCAEIPYNLASQIELDFLRECENYKTDREAISPILSKLRENYYSE